MADKAYIGIPPSIVVVITTEGAYWLANTGRHSPTGFQWGYGGSGPADLAYSLLLDATGDREVAEQWYQEFKWDYVARWETNSAWALSTKSIEKWLNERKNHAKVSAQ